MALPEFEQRETLEALDTIAKPAGLHIGSRTVVLERLGGLTNRNYKVTLGPTEESVEVEVYVLRIPSASTAEYIDRDVEQHNATHAAAQGIAPRYVGFDTRTGLSLSRYITQSRPMTPADFSVHKHSAHYVTQVGQILRRLHASRPGFRGTLSWASAFDTYLAQIEDRTENQREKAWLVEQFEPLRVADPSVNLVPSHIDPVPENFLLTDSQLWLIDWEFSAMTHPLWDLACFCVEADLPEAHEQRLWAAYGLDESDSWLQGEWEAFKRRVNLVSLAWLLAQQSTGNDNAEFSQLYDSKRAQVVG